MVMPSFCCRVRISRASPGAVARRVGERLVIRQTLVSAMIARPSATRCCCPPKAARACAQQPSGQQVGDPGETPAWSAAGSPRTFTPTGCSRHAQVREQGIRLDTIGSAARPAQRGDVAAVDQDRPSDGVSRPAIMRSVVDFRSPRGEQDHELARRRGEGDAVDGLGRAVVLADGLELERAHPRRRLRTRRTRSRR